MDTKQINLFVYDSKENFEKSKQFIGGVFKRLICIENITDLNKSFDTDILDDNEYVLMVIHVFATNQISGIKKFLTSGILENFPDLPKMYISDGVETEIKHLMVDAKIPHAPVYQYHEVYSKLQEDSIKVVTKKQALEHSANANTINKLETSYLTRSNYPQCDYAIITALEEDEMEKVLPMIVKTGKTDNKKHLIEYGHLAQNVNKKIVYASQQSTGMIDAAILAAELLVCFQPKFLIMTGVLGGKPNDVNIGDVVVATKVFTIDKGKVSEYGFQKETESSNTESSFITKFKREKANIVEFINKSDQTRKKNIEVHFGAIACVRQVIDLEGFFENNITPIDRKALALEMESYGVSRACDLVNDGTTTCLIIKSAMDNTIEKVDDAKTFAAWTSATFVKYILENDLI